MKRLTTLAAGLCLALLAVSPALTQSAAEMDSTLDSLFGGHETYRTFFEELQQAVAEDDREAVAAMVDYPFRARVGNKAVLIENEADFASDYEEIMTPEIKAAIADQTYETLFANWQGVSIGDGEVWFSGIGEDATIRITAING